MRSSMKLPVSTTWHNSLLDGPQGTCTKEVYGKLASDVIDGVRPALLLPQISRHEAGEHIRYAHQRGIRVNYLINTMCLINIHYSREGHSEILELLEWIGSIGVEIVTVGFPCVIHLVKEALPGMRIKASGVCRINSVNWAQQYEDLFKKVGNFNPKEAWRGRKGFEAFIEAMFNGELCAGD